MNFDLATHTQLSRDYQAAHEAVADLYRRRRAGEFGLARDITQAERRVRNLAQDLGLIPARKTA